VNDTAPGVDRKHREMLLQRSGEERLLMGCSMHATARVLVCASILAKEPHPSAARLRQEIFLRFYGGDFDPTTREKILAVLAGRARQAFAIG
jgi:hypothetical protein